MAVHAGLRWRDSSKRRILHGGVAVPAVEADATDVMRVAELDRLFDERMLLGHPPGPHQGKDDPSTSEHQAQDHRQAHAGCGVGAAREELAHSRLRKSALSLH